MTERSRINEGRLKAGNKYNYICEWVWMFILNFGNNIWQNKSSLQDLSMTSPGPLRQPVFRNSQSSAADELNGVKLYALRLWDVGESSGGKKRTSGPWVEKLIEIEGENNPSTTTTTSMSFPKCQTFPLRRTSTLAALWNCKKRPVVYSILRGKLELLKALISGFISHI